MKIDLNADIGEGFAEDEALLACISSANIACGEHAGSPEIMRRTVVSASRHGVAIGAHPGYADRANFGRTEMGITAGEACRIVLEQVEALEEIAGDATAQVGHIKLHGAMYHRAEHDAGFAGKLCDALEATRPHMMLYAQSGGRLAQAAASRGLPVANEVFADRAYEPDGTLTPRGQTNAVLFDEEEIAIRLIRLLSTGLIVARGGGVLNLTADTVCLHGDEPGAGRIASALRERLEASGFRIAPPYGGIP